MEPYSNDIAGLAEAMLKYVFKAVLEERADDMKFFAKRVDKPAGYSGYRAGGHV